MIERQIGQRRQRRAANARGGQRGGHGILGGLVAAGLGPTAAEVEERCDELVRRPALPALARRARVAGPDAGDPLRVRSRAAPEHAVPADSPARRRELHQSIGEREETGYADRARDIAAELAAHFEPAGDDARAVRYLEQAAETATRGRRTARRSTTRAGAGLADPLPGAARSQRSLAILEQIGLVRRTMGDMRAAVEDFDGVAHAREQGPHRRGDAGAPGISSARSPGSIGPERRPESRRWSSPAT